MKLKEYLDKASEEYYNGTPILSDEVFDRLAESISYNRVGHVVEDGVKLPYRLYSLQKFFVGEGPEPTLPSKDVVETLKLDGTALSLVYTKGELVAAIKRGDGETGQDVSHLIPALPVPKWLNTEESFQQITGEVVAPKTIDNARNYASGALNLKSDKECSTRQISFVAYAVKPYITSTYREDLKTLSALGFKTVLDSGLEEFPDDGTVFRINNNKSFEDVGYTSTHPKGAYALKTREEGLATKLLDVIWQVGRSGVVSPVAILDPVSIDGATISRATLHNMEYINSLGLEIGCNVEVIRAGKIIPRVVRKIN